MATPKFPNPQCPAGDNLPNQNDPQLSGFDLKQLQQVPSSTGGATCNVLCIWSVAAPAVGVLGSFNIQSSRCVHRSLGSYGVYSTIKEQAPIMRRLIRLLHTSQRYALFKTCDATVIY